MPYCPECGTELEGDEEYCPDCGEKVSSDDESQTEDKSDASTSENENDNNSSGNSLKKTISILAILLLVVSAAPIFPVQDTYQVQNQVDVNYEIVDTSSDFGTAINQYTGIGSSSYTISIRNMDNENGDFSVSLQCQTGNGNQIQLSDRIYIEGGKTGDITLTSDEKLEDCGSITVNPPQKTVTETQETTDRVGLIQYLS